MGLGNCARLTAMTGLPTDSPLASNITSDNPMPQAVDIATVYTLRKENLESTLTALETMHKQTADKTNATRQKRIDLLNTCVGVRACNFNVGKFVLPGVLSRHQHSKLALRWSGPFQIVQVFFEFIYVLQHLVTRKTGYTCPCFL